MAGLSLACCGGDDDREKVDVGGGKKTVLQQEDKKPDSAHGGSGGTEQAVTPQERQARAKVKLLKERLAKTTDSDDRAEILGEVVTLGAHAMSMWSEVVACFKDEEPFTRGFALQAAAKVNPTSCRELLEQGLKDDEAEVRKMAAEAWCQAEIKDLAPLLDIVPNELEAQVQMAIMVAVEKHGQKYHAAQVTKIMGDLDSNALKPAIRFLVEKGEDAPAFAPAIAEYLDRADLDLRVLAARSIEKLGFKNKAILTKLCSTLVDEESSVRKAGIETLRKLTGQDLGYALEDSEEERAESEKEWRDWVLKNG
ncbi:MAG: hypothetical protein CMJ83_14990 [Planctomycetes bacterium]|jgi:hypothetical protein|nr:hypothetical protein [Planctomycetota bacterium]